MAHGFLTPTPVTGESPIIGYLERKIGKQLEKIADHLKGIRLNTAKSRDTTYRSGRGGTEVAGRFGIGENTAVGGGFLPGRKAPKMLQGSSGRIEKNPTNVDLKTGAKVATPGGPKRLPGGASASTTPGITSTGGLKDSRFFSKSGELNIEKLRASGKSAEEQKLIVRDYRASLRARGVAPTGEGAPPITPDSGADIVAAVNRNTEAIVALSALTKDQTSKQVSMHNESKALDNRRANRALARAEERQLEEGGDFSDFLTPSKFKRLSPGSGSGGRGPNIGDIARTAGGLVNRSTYKAGGSAFKAGSTALKTLRSGGPKLLPAASAASNKIVPATVKTVDTALKPLEATNAMQKMVKGAGAAVGKSEAAGKIAISLGKTFAGTSIKKKWSPGAPGLGNIVEAVANNVDPKDAKALAATRKALPPGAGLSVLGDEGLGMITNSPDVLKALDKADDVSDGAATAKAIATAADAGATKGGLLSFLKGRKPKGLVRGSGLTRMMLRNPAGKMFLKKLPLIGAIAGGVFAVQRLMDGDFLGAGLELGSGILGATGLAPASLALDGLLLARDFGAVPFAKGGIITEPTNALMGEAGAEGVFPLEGAKGRKTFEMFGNAFVDAQKKRKKEVAQIQLEGYKLFAKEQEYMKVFDLFNPARWFNGNNGNNGNTQNRRGSAFSGRSPMVGPPPPVSGGRTGGTPLNSTGAKGVLDVIASVESNGSYDVFNTARGGTPGKATEKTIGWLAKNAQGAIGRYQHMPEFILERAARFGYDANTRFTPEVQDDITIKMMQEQHGLDDFLSGDMSAATFAAKLAPTWRGLPQGQKAANRLGGTADSTYMDQYSSGNKAHMSWADSVSNFERIQSGYDPKKKVTGLTPSAEDMNWYNNMQSSNPNTGTPLMATSAQVASASTSASPTVINNYYTGGNSGGQQQVNPNGVSAAPGMSATGTEVFQELKIRALA